MPDDANRVALFVPNAVAAQQCKDLIERTEAAGYREAGLSAVGGGTVMNKNIRDNDTVVLTDEALAGEIWQGVRDHVPDGAHARLDSRLRFYRYGIGQSFAKHQDGATVLEGEESKWTLLVYLNDEFEGGATRLCVFDDREVDRSVDVQPATGACFIFDHRLLHASTPITRGVKYAVRADVLFKHRL